jgi:hypothetical protein
VENEPTKKKPVVADRDRVTLIKKSETCVSEREMESIIKNVKETCETQERKDKSPTREREKREEQSVVTTIVSCVLRA